MANICMVIRKGYYETLSAFNWAHVNKYNRLESLFQDKDKQLRSLIKNKTEKGVEQLKNEFEGVKTELKVYREELYTLARAYDKG